MIHPTAIIDKDATIHQDVFIGPYCVIGSGVTLENNVHLVSHVSLCGPLRIGKGTKIYPFASLGHAPQDLKYQNEDSCVEIGQNNTIREYVTIQKGTKHGIMKTKVGNNCLLMVGVHIAHDCVVGDHVVMANQVTLAGHVEIGDFVVVGGLSAIQQYTRIGSHAMIGGMSAVERDVIPYGLVMGERAFLQGLNVVGLRRRGFSNEIINKLKKTYESIFNASNLLEISIHENDDDDIYVQNLLNFLKKGRKVCVPKK